MKHMKYKFGSTIPVGTLVYKKVCETVSPYNSRVLTCIVTKPGFCPNKTDGGMKKCRVREVFVAGVSGGKETEFQSTYISSFHYKLYQKKGTTFDTNKNNVCTDGIHVFLTKREAQNY